MPNTKKVKINNIEGEMTEIFGSRILKFQINNLEITIAGKLSKNDNCEN